MKRKVIKQANQAYTITLPIGWVRKNKISGKSELDIEDNGRSLIINNEKGIEIRKISIDVSGLHERTIWRHINALYAKGIDEIQIKSDKDISPVLLNVLNNTIGYALLSQKDNVFQIKDVGSANYSDLDEVFKRVFQIILSFYESAIRDIFEKQEETIEGLFSRDREVNKFCLYLQRAINKMSYPKAIKGRLLFTYSFEIEKIGDEISRLWKTNIKYKIKKTEKLKKLVELSSEGLGKAFEFYYQFNLKKAEEIYNIREKVRKDSLKLSNLDANTTRFVRHIVKIIEDAADLTHLTLMRRLK